MTGWGTIDTAVEAMRRGARSFVQKPWDDTTLVEVVRREIDDGRAARRRDARLAREHDEARLIQRALLPSTMPDASRLLARRAVDAGVRNRRRLLRRAALLGHARRACPSPTSSARACRPRCSCPTCRRPCARSRRRRGRAARRLHQREPAALPQHRVRTSFVTFCYAVIDTDAGTISYANAGHNPPLIARASGVVDRLEPTGLVLGVADDWTYSTRTVPLGAGDRLVWFTDGITEARVARRRRVRRRSPRRHSFASASPRPPRRCSTSVGRGRARLDGRRRPQDDATLIVAAIAIGDRTGPPCAGAGHVSILTALLHLPHAQALPAGQQACRRRSAAAHARRHLGSDSRRRRRRHARRSRRSRRTTSSTISAAATARSSSPRRSSSARAASASTSIRSGSRKPTRTRRPRASPTGSRSSSATSSIRPSRSATRPS